MKRSVIALTALLVFALAGARAARSVSIKLATVVPDVSVWDKNLKQMAEEAGDRRARDHYDLRRSLSVPRLLPSSTSP